VAKTQKVRAGWAFVEIFADSSKLHRGLAKASRALKSWGQTVARAGMAITAAGSAMLVPFIGSIKVFQAYGDVLDKMAKRTGLSVAAISKLSFAMEQGGGSAEQLEKGIAGMARFMLTLEQKSKTAEFMVGKLGLTFKDLDGLAPEDQFRLIAAAIGRIEDPTLQAGIALAIFGRAGRQMLPMLNDIEALEAEADALGLTLGEDVTDAAAALTDMLNKLKRTLTAVAVKIGYAIHGPLLEWGNQIAVIIGNTGRWVSANHQIIQTMALTAAAVTAAGVAITGMGMGLVAAGMAISAISTILATITSLLAFIFSPAGIIGAVAIAGLVAAFESSLIPAFMAFYRAIGEVGAEFSRVFADVPGLLKIGEFETAFKMIEIGAKLMMAKIKLNMMAELNAVESAWNAFWTNLPFIRMYYDEVAFDGQMTQNRAIREELRLQQEREAATRRQIRNLEDELELIQQKGQELIAQDEAAGGTEDRAPFPMGHPRPLPGLPGMPTPTDIDTLQRRIKTAISGATSGWGAINLMLQAPSNSPEIEQLKAVASNTAELVDQGRGRMGVVFE